MGGKSASVSDRGVSGGDICGILCVMEICGNPDAEADTGAAAERASKNIRSAEWCAGGGVVAGSCGLGRLYLRRIQPSIGIDYGEG